MNNKHLDILYKLSLKAYKKGEIPVAAIIVSNNKIISKAYNKRNTKKNILLHAEIQAILKASKKRKDWRLNDCIMYVTLKPCHMCREIIKESRISKIYYLVDNDKVINYKSEFLLLKESDSFKFSNLLTNFFKKLR